MKKQYRYSDAFIEKMVKRFGTLLKLEVCDLAHGRFAVVKYRKISRDGVCSYVLANKIYEHSWVRSCFMEEAALDGLTVAGTIKRMRDYDRDCYYRTGVTRLTLFGIAIPGDLGEGCLIPNAIRDAQCTK